MGGSFNFGIYVYVWCWEGGKVIYFWEIWRLEVGTWGVEEKSVRSKAKKERELG